MMEQMTFNTTINANRETVWAVLWGDTTYPQWTSAFCEGSHAVTNWQKGSKVLFLDGKGSGMVSRVAENIPNEFMSFEHLGEVKNGVEDTESEQVIAWAGAHENYTLKTVDNHTELLVELDADTTSEEFKSFFLSTWPIAMAKIKALAEA
jgi:uncharacterized protein YndB with AHSA1/START domain